MELVIAGNDGEKPKSLRQLQCSSSKAREATNQYAHGVVELHDFLLSARIPTEFQGHYLIYQIVGNQREALIVSPTGATATDSYFKPMGELKTDLGPSGSYIGEGANRMKSTDEDTERYWLLKNPEFRGELSAKGWMIFPEIEKVEEHEQRAWGSHFTNDRHYKRSFKLTDFIRVLELTSTPGKEDHAGVVRDLGEVANYGNDITYFWEAGSDGRGSFFGMNFKYEDKWVSLKLEDKDRILDFRRGDEKGTLTRKVLIELTERLSSETWELIREYSKINNLHVAQEYDDEKFGRTMLSLADRDYSDSLPAPDTPKLIKQALEFRSFVDRIRTDSSEQERKEYELKLAQKRERLGLPPVAKQK